MDLLNNRRINLIMLASVAILFLATAFFMLLQSGALDSDPVVEVMPDNCYDRTLTVITDEDYRPYSFTDAQGNHSGHDVELITMIANRLRMNLDLRFMEWYEAIDAITAGEADVLMTCDFSDSFPGVDRLIKSEAVSGDDFIVYSKKKITSIDELYGSRLGIMQDGNVTEHIRMMNLEQNCSKFENNRQVMRALEEDRIDYAVMRQTVGTVLLEELDTTDISGYISIGQSYMCFGVYDGRPELVGEINNAIDELRISGELGRLRDKWLTTFVRRYTFTEVLLNNSWVVFVLAALLLVVLRVLQHDRAVQMRAENEKYRSAQVVEQLAQDFECVNYIVLTDSAEKDPVINYRVSERLKRYIPGWETEKIFHNKLGLLRDTLVYEPDRERYWIDINRKRVTDELKEQDVYYANLRLFFDGEPHYYQYKFSAVREDGDLVGLVVGLHSVDEQTRKELRLNEQLQTALQAAEVANRSKSDFLFNMSHDIRTPMNAILGFTMMASKHIDDRDKVSDCLLKTQKAGNLLLGLINSILDVSRIESGKVSLNESPGDVNLSFAAIEDTMGALAAANDIRLTFEIGEVTDRFVYCDFSRINRVFVNIISNAIKYSKKGGYVRVRCVQAEKASEGRAVYRYTFEDNGIGMSEEFQKHIFEQFSREQSVTLSGIQGSGLGMSVCKSFVELLGGTIECRSKLGEGTTFTVLVPFRLQEGERYTNPFTGETVEYTGGDEAGHAADEEIARRKLNESISTLRDRRILLTEDNELNMEIATALLEDYGLHVETAKDGTEAVELLRVKGPYYYDFILMDIQMPVMNGYEATREIRRMYPDDAIPIIALSANAFSEDKEESLAAGMDEHVAKPINAEELLRTLLRQNERTRNGVPELL